MIPMSLECTADIVVFAMSLGVQSQSGAICHVADVCNIARRYNVGKMEGIEGSM